MLVYIVCAHVEYDSYHQLVLATLNEKDALRAVSEHNDKHEDECKAYQPGGSDWDECFCKLYHMHDIELGGIDLIALSPPF